MKLKNALKKIIHSVCLISVLFLSVFFVLPPIDSYAEANCSIMVTYNGSDPNNGAYFLAYNNMTNNGLIQYSQRNTYVDVEIVGGRVYSFFLGRYGTNAFNGSVWTSSCVFYVDSVDNSHKLSTDPNSPTLLPYRSSYNFIGSGTTSAANTRYYVEFTDFPTPTPTPTPLPTATPGPTASPTPDANAEAFFGKLGSDAQNGFGAILTAWTAANSHFYTSVLFIVLPVFLGIVGLIASFFFGGGDDD